MFRNYLKIAFRNLMKYKFISFINLFGLTVGIACCLLILTYILHELSFDRYNRNAESIYRVERTFINPESGDINLRLGTVAPPFAPLLQNDFKEIKKITRFLSNGVTAFRYEEKRFNDWIKEPLQALGGATPFSLLDNQFGREEVRDLIGRIAYGVYS